MTCLYKSCLLSLFYLFLISVAFGQKVEAENGTLNGTTVGNTHAGFSGDGYVTGFENDNDAVTMTLNVDAGGLFDLWVGYSAPYGEKTNDIYVNGDFAGAQIFEATHDFEESYFGKIYLESGNNSIKVLKNWGYFEVDYIRAAPTTPNPIHNYPENLINDEATYEANIVYRYLRDLYGHRIIAGQQAYHGEDLETEFLMEETGKLPAMKGFDLIDYSPSRVERGTTSQQTELSIEWWAEQGGIVSLMWHWNAPKGLIDTEDAPWWSGFYTYATTFDHTIAMNDPESEEYELIIRDIDAIAEELKIIEAADVPVLWRPLHEAEGEWFWWGSKGSEACVWLWKLMYDRLQNHHELDNLIWVWTGTNSASALDWYPGDEYVDIIGADVYLDDQNYSTSFSLFDGMAGIHEGSRIITMSETGTIPDPDALVEEKAKWSWFCVWEGDFILDGNVNEVEHINKVYNHEYVITLDELPDFYNYESPEFPDEEVVSAVDPTSTIVRAFPNPTDGMFHIQSKRPIEGAVVYNLRGEVIWQFGQRSTRGQLEIGLTKQPAGIYLVQVILTEGSEQIKLRKL